MNCLIQGNDVVLTSAMETLGGLLRSLREKRRMTQRELALAAGFSDDVIAKVEQDRRLWSPRTARSVLQALAKKEPLTTDQAVRFLRLSDLLPDGPGLPAELHDELVEQGVIRGVAGPAAAGAASAPPSVGALVDQALAAFGPEYVAAVLRLLLARPSTPAAESEPRLLNVVSPPVQRPGYVEQTIRTFEHLPAPASPPETPAQPKRFPPPAHPARGA